MRQLAPFILAALVAVPLVGCATATPPAEVTRFHRLAAADAMLPAGRFVIAEPEGVAADPEWRSYAGAVAAELVRLGYARAETGAADYRVRVGFERASAPRAAGGSGVGVGVGGSTGSYGSGVGVGVGIDLTRLLGGGAADTALRLSVRIDRASDGQSLWEGRAETAVRARAPAAQPGLASARLAGALFAGFPGRSGETITVR